MKKKEQGEEGTTGLALAGRHRPGQDPRAGGARRKADVAALR